MEKRKLSAIPRPIATPEMMEVADRLGGMRHIATAELIDDKKILLLFFLSLRFRLSRKEKQKQLSGHFCRTMIISRRI